MFVVYGEMFDRNDCINMAELEFPAYFNFFVKKKAVKIVTTPDLEARIRTVFQETLLGPLKKDYDCKKDFHVSVPSDAYPRFWEEGCSLDAFRKDLTVDKLLSFVHFSDETGVARLSDRVQVTVAERPCEARQLLVLAYAARPSTETQVSGG